MMAAAYFTDPIILFAFISLLSSISAELSRIPKFDTYECYSCSWNTFSMDGDVMDVPLPGEVASISIQTLCADPFRKERKMLSGDYVKFEGFLPVSKCPTSKCQKINVETNNRGNFIVRRCLPKGASCQTDKVIEATNITQTVNCCDGHMCNGVERPVGTVWRLLGTLILIFISITLLA